MKEKRLYTSTKIAIWAAVFTAVFFIFLFLFMGINMREYIYDDSKELAKEISRSAAVQTERYFNSALMVAKSMAKRALLIREHNGSRERVREMLVYELTANNNFLGAWTLWEPNAFDGNDSQFAGKPLHDSKGTLGNGYFLYNDSIHVEVMSDKEYLATYYVLPKEKRAETVTTPYKWRYAGYNKQFYGTSISVPLIYKQSFLGAVGLDIDINSLQTELNNTRPYKSGYLALIASNGHIVTHPDSAFVSQNIFSIIPSTDSIKYASVLVGNEFTIETKSEFTGQSVFRFFYPIRIGNSQTWSIMVELPIRDTVARSNEFILIALVIFLVGFGLVVFLIFNIFDRLRYEKAIIKAMSDVEERSKAAAENLRNYEEVFNSTSESILVYDLNERVILDVNEVTLKLFGYSTKKELIGRRLNYLSSEQSPYLVRDVNFYLQKAKDEGPQVFEWLAKRGTGETFWAEVSLRSAIINGHDRLLAITRDITERKETALELKTYQDHLELLVKERTEDLEAANEELKAINDELYDKSNKLHEALVDLQNAQNQLVQSEKMASLGVLASGIAHEINNPLNFIQGGILGIENYLETHLPDHKKDVDPLVAAIKEGIHRSVVIVNSLNQYTRKDTGIKANYDLYNIINNSIIMVRGQLSNNISLHCNLPDDHVSVYCNEGQLHQVFLNVLLNAVQAINTRGLIEINATIKSKRVKIYIKDDGCGINTNNLDKITDPFFTTREPGQGTGLGLSIVASIIRDHKGKIDFKSVEGEGTTVVITLPISN